MEVELWYSFTGGLSGHDFTAFQDLLHEDEKERSTLFHFESDRRSFVLAHGLLRIALSNRYARDPQTWTLSYDAKGKPALDGPDADDVRFSISHSRGLSICALTDAPVALGCDAESLNHTVDIETQMAEFFSISERSHLEGLRPDERTEASWSLWTLKEAYLKAIGTGLDRPPTEFSISMKSSDSNVISECAICGAPCKKWSLARTVSSMPYAVGVAVHGIEQETFALHAHHVLAPTQTTSPLIRSVSTGKVNDLRLETR